jgi:hypothetical protein
MSMLSDVSGLMGRGLLQLLTDVSPAAVATIFRGAVEAAFSLTPLRLMNQSTAHQPGNVTYTNLMLIKLSGFFTIFKFLSSVKSKDQKN